MTELRAKRLKEKYASQAAPQQGRPRGQMGGPGGHGPGGGHGNQNVTGKPKNAAQTIHRLFHYLGKDKGTLIIVCICVILSTVLMLASSYMLRPIINGLTNKTGVAALLRGILLMLALYLAATITQYLQMRLMVEVSQRAVTQMRKDLFAGMLRLPVRYFDTHPFGDLMSRFTNDVDAVGEMLNNTMVQLIAGAFQLVGTLILMVYTNWLLALLIVVVTPLMLLATKGVIGMSRKYYQSQQEALGTLNGYIEETVSGQKVVKVFNHEEMARDEFGYLNGELKQKQVKAQFFGSIMGPVMGNIGQLTYVLVGCVGGILCVTSGFDLGGLTIFVNYARQFSRPISEIAMQTNTIFAALAGAERVFKVMDEQPEAEINPGNTELTDCTGKIEAQHVTFSYDGVHTILKDINFTAQPGQRIAFVGSTGAGKTTITNLVNRFYDVNEGRMCIDDTDIREFTRDSLRSEIAMVLQDTHLFGGTIRENIRFGRLDATDEEVEQAARVAGAHSFINRLEHGYDTVLSGDGASLSQGQRQLLNIARAAISKAPILILDEATSSVDTRTERHIEHGLARLMAQRTTLVIAHRLSTVVSADQILVLEHGQVIERGTHAELLDEKGRYYQLYNGLAELA